MIENNRKVKILFRKDYAFSQVIIGIILILIPIALMISLHSNEMSYENLKVFFTLSGLIGGGVGIYLITNGYYKLTDKFKEYEIEELMNLRKTEEKRE